MVYCTVKARAEHLHYDVLCLWLNITAPPVLVQPVLDLWAEHQLKTASFDHCVDCFLFTKRLIFILDTLDQLVTLCSRDRFRVCFPTAWWNTPVFCIDIQTWHRLHGAACASAQLMDATFWLFFFKNLIRNVAHEADLRYWLGEPFWRQKIEIIYSTAYSM